MNTPESSASGNVHGMPLAALVGSEPAELARLSARTPAVDPSRTVLLGIRDLDSQERENIRRSGVHVFTMSDIDRHGMAAVAQQALAAAGADAAGIHVSFDMDVCDPAIAPGVGTAVRGGLGYREAHLLMEMVADSGRLTSLDLVEINPILDVQNTTAMLGMELALSALGQTMPMLCPRAEATTHDDSIHDPDARCDAVAGRSRPGARPAEAPAQPAGARPRPPSARPRSPSTTPSPSMRGRKIMGGLVPYDKVWRTGANAATTLKTTAALDFGGTLVPAGTYTLYTLPGEKGWKLIINKQTGQWGTQYDQAQDLARVDLKVDATCRAGRAVHHHARRHGRPRRLAHAWSGRTRS